MYCPKCYRLNDDTAEVCSACGHRFGKKDNDKLGSNRTTKYCSHCGNKILIEAVICPKCGCETESHKHSQDKPSIILDVISILIPIVGLILFLCFHHNYPQKAKSVGISALVGVAVYIFFPYLLVALLQAI